MTGKNGKLTAWEIVNGNLLAMKMKDQVYIKVCDWELETIRMELQKYAKYEKAFEILKRHNFSIGKNANTETGYYIHCESELLTDECELLEELMNDVQ